MIKGNLLLHHNVTMIASSFSPSGLCQLSNSLLQCSLQNFDRPDIPQNNMLVHYTDDIMLIGHEQEVVKVPRLPESGR